jgi:hypothetical protein
MKKKAFLIIGLLLVALLLYSRTSSAAARSPLSKLTPTVKQPTWLSNEIVRQVSQKEPTGSGQLIIQNGTGSDAQVKVIDTSTNKAVYNVYVPSHQNYTITGIDDGTYALAFWLGDANTGSGQKFKDTFNYKTIGVETTTYTVTLGGNAPADVISRGVFENY